MRGGVPRGPRLDGDTALLQNLAHHRLLEALALIDESRQARVKSPGPLAVAAQEGVIAARAQGEHRGHEVGVKRPATPVRRARRLVTGFHEAGRRAASRTESLRALPPNETRGGGEQARVAPPHLGPDRFRVAKRDDGRERVGGDAESGGAAGRMSRRGGDDRVRKCIPSAALVGFVVGFVVGFAGSTDVGGEHRGAVRGAEPEETQAVAREGFGGQVMQQRLRGDPSVRAAIVFVTTRGPPRVVLLLSGRRDDPHVGACEWQEDRVGTRGCLGDGVRVRPQLGRAVGVGEREERHAVVALVRRAGHERARRRAGRARHAPPRAGDVASSVEARARLHVRRDVAAGRRGR